MTDNSSDHITAYVGFVLLLIIRLAFEPAVNIVTRLRFSYQMRMYDVFLTGLHKLALSGVLV